MFSLFNLVLAIHRTIWFPLNYALGLEGTGVELPVEWAPHIAAGQVDPDVAEQVMESGTRRTRAAASW